MAHASAHAVSERVSLVTGSTSGIGLAVARRLIARGDRVVFHSSTSVEEGERLAAQSPGALYRRADLADEEQCTRLVDEVLAETGRLDLLVNNAGTTRVIPHADLTSATREIWREIFEVNLFGTWSVSVAAIEALRAARGSIVNVSSIAGLRPTGSSIPYAASKAALNHLTVLLAKVVGPEVRVNAVAPGLVDTPWTADWDVVRDFVTKVAPLRRSATPDDVAEAVLSLAEAAYVTGQVVAVDGGLTLAT